MHLLAGLKLENREGKRLASVRECFVKWPELLAVILESDLSYTGRVLPEAVVSRELKKMDGWGLGRQMRRGRGSI